MSELKLIESSHGGVLVKIKKETLNHQQSRVLLDLENITAVH